MKKIVLIGTIPPPVGGVSIHLSRFFNKYKYHKDLDLFLLDIKKKKINTKNSCSIFSSIKYILEKMY